jgi:hypothetical protein
MYEKFWGNGVRADPECAEDLADVLYELGKGLCNKKQYELAAVWLERALDAIDDQELDRLSDNASELRLAIMQQLGERRDLTACGSELIIRSQISPYVEDPRGSG